MGEGNYVVIREGDCVDSIAYEHGLWWQTIWNHPNNRAIRQARSDPSVLLPGDRLYVPERRKREDSGQTGQRHRFRQRGVPAKLRMRLIQMGEPRSNEPYILDIDGQLSSGTTDDDGRLEHPITPNARRAKLLLLDGQEEHILQLGNIDPVDEITGVQARLSNLGYRCTVDGQLGPKTRAALSQFQKDIGLEQTGQPDRLTLQRLEEEHGL